MSIIYPPFFSHVAGHAPPCSLVDSSPPYHKFKSQTPIGTSYDDGHGFLLIILCQVYESWTLTSIYLTHPKYPPSREVVEHLKTQFTIQFYHWRTHAPQ
jgi:hypothetical protein